MNLKAQEKSKIHANKIKKIWTFKPMMPIEEWQFFKVLK